jgi:tetratricopeptide (TPR) repeat protein
VVRSRTRLAWLLALAVTLAGGRAWGEARTEKAREHYLQGDAYYKLDKYAEALREYEQAYIAKPDPSFLYNIAQCHRLTGDRADALKFYRRYLRDAPAAPNRAIAEKHIRELEASLAHPAEHGEAPPPTLAALPPPSPPSPTTTATTTSMPEPAATAPQGRTLALAASPPSESGAPAATLTESAHPADADRDDKPFYKKWWFWTAVGVAVGGTLLLVAASGHDPRCPSGSICK